MVSVKVSSEEVDVAGVIRRVMSPDCGGISVFVGTVRDNYEGKRVKGVNIEAYDAMAVEDLERIAKEVKDEFGVREISIHHRTGRLNVGDVIVAIAVSAPHRKEAFGACREIIERLKKTTPIWKQEFLDDGQRWAEDDRHGSNG
ncbi:MAG: molybdenum cofactor biosynthesis protein MoaE [Thermoplasmata archaeon]